jgi:thiol:disulfide interchange protein DsbD
VLALKVSALLDASPGAARRARHRMEAYAGGILFTFVLLGGLLAFLRPAGAGWGFQLQSPWFVGGLVGGFVFMAASMAGWWTFPAVRGQWISSALSRHDWIGDALSGALAVIVASPCVGPFLGAALATAFLVPPLQAALLFLAMGLGLAAPALVLAWVPAARARMPRPGAWMETVRRWMALPLFAAALWLAWVLSRLSTPAIALAVILGSLAVLAWLPRTSASLPAARRLSPLVLARVSAPLAVALLVLGSWAVPSGLLAGRAPTVALDRAPADGGTLSSLSTWAFTPTPDTVLSLGPNGPQPFTPARLERLRQSGRTIFVSIGADWCITCTANDLAVLERPEFRAQLRKKDAVWLRGDWTRQDPAISAFLKSYGAPGVPLYLVFGPQGVKQLPQLLSTEQVRQALM